MIGPPTEGVAVFVDHPQHREPEGTRVRGTTHLDRYRPPGSKEWSDVAARTRSLSRTGNKSAIATVDAAATGDVHSGATGENATTHPVAQPPIKPIVIPIGETRRSITDIITTTRSGPAKTPKMICVRSNKVPRRLTTPASSVDIRPIRKLQIRPNRSCSVGDSRHNAAAKYPA